MNKERTFVTCVVSFLVLGTLVFTGATDGIYLAAAIGFFLLCAAYAAWCEKI